MNGTGDGNLYALRVHLAGNIDALFQRGKCRVDTLQKGAPCVIELKRLACLMNK